MSVKKKGAASKKNWGNFYRTSCFGVCKDVNINSPQMILGNLLIVQMHFNIIFMKCQMFLPNTVANMIWKYENVYFILYHLYDIIGILLGSSYITYFTLHSIIQVI